MVCNECGRNLRSINTSHLQKCCNLTQSQYLTKYPNCLLIDDDVKKSYGSAGEKNGKWRGGISKPNCKCCGKSITQKSRIEYCRKCSNTVKGNPFQGKSHSDATRQCMVEAAALRDRTTYHKIVNDPAMLSQYAKVRWNNIVPEEKARRLVNFIAAGQRTNKRSKNTKIELAVASMLSSLGIVYEHTHKIERYYVDYLVGHKTIECYGDYWHCNPNIYAADVYHKSLHMTCLEKRVADQVRVDTLVASGYEVLCLWETDIPNHKDWCLSRIISFLKGQNG